MIVLVTGGREYQNPRELKAALDHFHGIHNFTYLVHGDARGADQMAHRWAKKNGVQPVAFEALWDVEGDDSGTLRNGRMIAFSNPDLVIAFSGGRGTANCMRQAHAKGIPIEDVEDYQFP